MNKKFGLKLNSTSGVGDLEHNLRKITAYLKEQYTEAVLVDGKANYKDQEKSEPARLYGVYLSPN